MTLNICCVSGLLGVTESECSHSSTRLFFSLKDSNMDNVCGNEANVDSACLTMSSCTNARETKINESSFVGCETYTVPSSRLPVYINPCSMAMFDASSRVETHPDCVSPFKIPTTSIACCWSGWGLQIVSALNQKVHMSCKSSVYPTLRITVSMAPGEHFGHTDTVVACTIDCKETDVVHQPIGRFQTVGFAIQHGHITHSAEFMV